MPIAEAIKLGTKYDANCVCCGRLAGGSKRKRESVLLVKVDGRFAVSHVPCAGGAIFEGKYLGAKTFETNMPF